MVKGRLMTDRDLAVERLARARLSLEGLSVGDALGEQFFSPWIRESCLLRRCVPDGPWRWTDDTAMALGIVEVLERMGEIDQDELARVFGHRYDADPERGYGPAQHELLRDLHRGRDWRERSQNLFGGRGSFGNGGAMRAAPIGAYFADDLSRVVDEARRSAEVTHAHPDGIAGAIAVAVAAAWAWQWNRGGRMAPRADLFSTVLERTPPGPTRSRIELAAAYGPDEWEFDVANVLGDGSDVTACDTVPFCLWVASRHLDNYPEALWTAIRVHGDIDTNCAILGGIVALSHGESGVPDLWRRSRERLR